MYKFKKLKTEKDFQKYSPALQEFEKEFDYPLADKRFTIMHGDNNINYFEFFKRLGDVSYFIVEKNNVIIGAGVAILKNIKDNGNNIKYWYLGDFKITKAYRKKGILKLLTLKYFVTHYIKSNKMIAVNMSPIDKNGLVKKVNKLFSWFNVKNTPLYFYEWDYNTFKKDILLNDYIQKNYVLFTNNSYKDIVIEECKLPLYHLVQKEYALNNYNNLYQEINANTLEKINNNSSFMFCTPSEKIKQNFKNESIIHTSESSFISHKIDIDNCHFFSGEI